MMKHALKLLAAFVLATPAALHAAAVTPLAAGRIPFPDVLDAAALVQDRLDDITLRSGKAQTVLLELPAEISAVTMEGKGGKVAKATSAKHRKLTLPAMQDVTLRINFKR